ncbi:MAG TPA: response regulator, partial [Roseimicrobium sp.]|nr:response regulator [Roseimicrobium sp.]
LEDNLVSSNLVVSTLRRDLPKVTFTPAINLKEATEHVCNRHFDLFILDINLPDGNSIDFLYELQQSQPETTPRAIFMTASKLPEYRRRAEAMGAVQFLEKPVRMKDLVQLVEQLLSQPIRRPDAFFEGTLSCLTPIDLVQLKCLSQAAVGLRFTQGNGVSGTVYFHGGNVVHAETGGQFGEAAFTKIVGWKSGKVEEVSPFGSRTPTITLPWTALLMNAAHALDEQQGA